MLSVPLQGQEDEEGPRAPHRGSSFLMSAAALEQGSNETPKELQQSHFSLEHLFKLISGTGHAALLSSFFNSVPCLAAVAFSWSILFDLQPFRCSGCICVSFRSVLPLLALCWPILPLCFVFQSHSNL